MAAAFSVLAADEIGSTAALSGRFDESNCWFLEKHLNELQGDVVLDFREVNAIDVDAATALQRFATRALRGGRSVMFRYLPPKLFARVARTSAADDGEAHG